MTQVTRHWEFHFITMKGVAEEATLQVMRAKTRVGKDLEISGAARNVEIHVLVWNVSL